jgi:translation initiation factor eIF-2B subunit epsilon
MSLVNVPPLAYAIEFLSSAGVQEIFVFATAHADQIQQFVRTSIWKDAPNLSIHVVVGPDCVSAGDALREIDARQLIKDDFVLINADVISNMKLDAVLAAHKARRAKDKHAILTMVFKEVAPHHRTLSLEDDLVVALDASTGQLLHYDNDFASRDVQLDTAAFADHRAIELRHDLIDTRIDICAPELLFQFTDNFDYQDLRADFLHGVVTSEILGNSIHTHVIKDEYAARMKDLRTYAAVSTDIVHRWAFPMVPDLNWWQRRDDGDYKLLRRSVYRDRNVTLNRTAVLGGGTVVGGFTTIGAGSRLENCIIGRRCVIGDNVQLSNCFSVGRRAHREQRACRLGDHVRQRAGRRGRLDRRRLRALVQRAHRRQLQARAAHQADAARAAVARHQLRGRGAHRARQASAAPS